MHDTAYRIGELVMRTYCNLPEAKILEIGSLNVNGCLRDAAAPTTQYIGLDLDEGPSVDIVIQPGAALPVDDDSFDLVMASSVFEHDPQFWETFVRMCRAARPGGHIYVNAPSNGTVHRYPMDCWRFYPDAGLALADHARSQGFEIDLVESFVGERHSDVWNDFVAVFRKGPSAAPLNTEFVYLRYPSRNARTWQSRAVYHESDATEDMAIIDALQTQNDELLSSAEELAQARRELLEERSIRQSLQAEMDKLSEAFTKTEAEKRQSHADCEHLMAKVSALEGSLREGDRASAQYQSAVEQLAAERDFLRGELETQQASSETETARLRELIAVLQYDHRQHEEQIANVRARAEDISQERDHAIRKAEEREAAFQDEKVEWAGQISMLESNLRQRQEEIAQAWDHAQRVTRERELLEGEIARLVAEQERLNAKVAKSDAWIFDLAGQRRSLENRLTVVQSELRQANRLIGRLKSAAEAAQHKAALGDLMLAGAKQLAALEKSPEQLPLEAERLSEEWQLGDHPLASVAALLHTAAHSASVLLQQKQALHGDVEMLLDRVESMNELEAKIAQLSETVASLRSEALNYQAKSAHAQEQLDQLRAEHKSQTRDLQALEDRVAQKDHDLRWLQRLYQLLESEQGGWAALMPPLLRKQRVANHLRRAGLFDSEAYLERYPDVAEAGVDPLRHYVLHGMSEGRRIG